MLQIYKNFLDKVRYDEFFLYFCKKSNTKQI